MHYKLRKLNILIKKTQTTTSVSYTQALVVRGNKCQHTIKFNFWGYWYEGLDGDLLTLIFKLFSSITSFLLYLSTLLLLSISHKISYRAFVYVVFKSHPDPHILENILTQNQQLTEWSSDSITEGSWIGSSLFLLILFRVLNKSVNCDYIRLQLCRFVWLFYRSWLINQQYWFGRSRSDKSCFTDIIPNRCIPNMIDQLHM